MKKFALLAVGVFVASSLIGCSKKNAEETSMEGLNGVATENVISVTDPNVAISGQSMDAVPVLVENAPISGDMAAGIEPLSAMPVITEKPTNKQIQQALKNAGFYQGKVDGDIGPKTKRAIEAFQSQNGLKADGKVGKKTWSALASYLNKPAEVLNPSAAEQAIGQ